MRVKSRDRDSLLGEQQCREDSRHREHSTFRASDTPGSVLVSTKRLLLISVVLRDCSYGFSQNGPNCRLYFPVQENANESMQRGLRVRAEVQVA